jgi:hypothetical protein
VSPDLFFEYLRVARLQGPGYAILSTLGNPLNQMHSPESLATFRVTLHKALVHQTVQRIRRPLISRVQSAYPGMSVATVTMCWIIALDSWIGLSPDTRQGAWSLPASLTSASLAAESFDTFFTVRLPPR